MLAASSAPNSFGSLEMCRLQGKERSHQQQTASCGRLMASPTLRKRVYFRMSSNKAPAATGFRPPPRPALWKQQEPSVSETGLCGTPLAAVASVYSAALTSHEKRPRGARRSAVTPRQWALDPSHAFLRLWVAVAVWTAPSRRPLSFLASLSHLFLKTASMLLLIFPSWV